MGIRAQQAKETKEKIIDSAYRLMSERGVDAVTTADIIADCGIAKGTLYHHFTSKDEIVTAVINHVYPRLEQSLQQGGKNGSATCTEQVLAFIRAWGDTAAKLNLHLSRYYVAHLAGSSGAYGENATHIEQGIEILQKLLQQAVEKGELRPDTPVTDLSRTMMFAMQGATIFHCRQEKDFDMHTWCESFLTHTVTPTLRFWHK